MTGNTPAPSSIEGGEEVEPGDVELVDKYPKSMAPIYEWIRFSLDNPGVDPEVPLLEKIREVRMTIEGFRDNLTTIADITTDVDTRQLLLDLRDEV